MRWIAVVALVVVGLVEFIFRFTALFVMAVTIVPMFMLMLLLEEGLDPKELTSPFCWRMVDRVVELEERDARELVRLRRDNSELRELMMHSEVLT